MSIAVVRISALRPEPFSYRQSVDCVHHCQRRQRATGGRNISLHLADKKNVANLHSPLPSLSGGGRIAGWRLVRTHAAGAARVLPRRATPRPLGASLLAAKASPAGRLLGASLLAAQNRRGRCAVP